MFGDFFSSLYDSYYYFVKRPSGLIWSKISLLFRSFVFNVFLYLILGPAQQFIGIFRFLRDKLKNSINRLSAFTEKNFPSLYALGKKASRALSRVSDYFFGSNDQTEGLYRSTAPMSIIQEARTEEINSFEFEGLDTEDQLFLNICCGSITSGLSVPEPSIRDYIQHLIKFKNSISDSNKDALPFLLKEDDLFLQQLSETAGNVQYSAKINDLLTSQQRISFCSGYTFENKDDKTEFTNLLVEIRKINCNVYIFLYQNIHDRLFFNEESIMREKGIYHKNVTILKINLKNQPDIEMKDLSNSRLISLLSIGEQTSYDKELSIRISFYNNELSKLNKKIRDCDNKIGNIYKNRRKYSYNSAEDRSLAKELKNIEKDKKTLEKEEKKLQGLLYPLKDCEGKESHKIFMALFNEALLDFNTEYVRRTEPDIKTEFELKYRESAIWKNLNAVIKNRCLELPGNYVELYNKFKFEFVLYTLKEFYNKYKSGKKYNKLLHKQLEVACENISRQIVKYYDFINIDTIHETQKLLKEIKSFLSIPIQRNANEQQKSKTSQISIEGPSIVLPEILVKDKSKSQQDVHKQHKLQIPVFDEQNTYLGFDNLLSFCSDVNVSAEEKLITLENFINTTGLEKIQLPLENVTHRQKIEMIDIIFNLSTVHGILCKEVGQDKLRLESQVCSLTLAYFINIQGLDAYNFNAYYENKKIQGRINYNDISGAEKFVEEYLSFLGIYDLKETCEKPQLNLNPLLTNRKQQISNCIDKLHAELAKKALQINRLQEKEEYKPKKPSYFERVFSGKIAEICKSFRKSLGKNLFFRICDEVIIYQKMEFCRYLAKKLSTEKFDLDKIHDLSTTQLLGLCSVLPSWKDEYDDSKFRKDNPVHAYIHDFPNKLSDYTQRFIDPHLEYSTSTISTIASTTMAFFKILFGIYILTPCYVISKVSIKLYLAARGDIYYKFEIESKTEEMYENGSNKSHDLIAQSYLSSKTSLKNTENLVLVPGVDNVEELDRGNEESYIGISSLCLKGKGVERQDGLTIANRIYSVPHTNDSAYAGFVTLYLNAKESVIGQIYELIHRHESYLRDPLLNNHIYQDILYANLFYHDVISSQIGILPRAIVNLFDYIITRANDLVIDPKNLKLCNFYLKVCTDLIAYISRADADVKLALNSITEKLDLVIELNHRLQQQSDKKHENSIHNDVIEVSLLISELHLNNRALQLADINKLFFGLLKIKSKFNSINGHSYTMWSDILNIQEFLTSRNMEIEAMLGLEACLHNLIKNIFIKFGGKKEEQIEKISGEYPVCYVKTENNNYTINLKLGYIYSEESTFGQCPIYIVNCKAYTDYFGHKIFDGEIINNGNEFLFTEDSVLFRLVLAKNTKGKEVLLIKRSLSYAKKDYMCLLIKSDALNNQLPTILLDDINYEYWFDVNENIIFIVSKHDKSIVYTVQNNDVINVKDNSYLICAIKNFGNSVVQTLLNIAKIDQIAIWYNKDTNTFSYTIPILNLTFTQEGDGNVVPSFTTEYKLNTAAHNSEIIFNNYILLEPTCADKNTSSMILTPKSSTIERLGTQDLIPFSERVGRMYYNLKPLFTEMQRNKMKNNLMYASVEISANNEGSYILPWAVYDVKKGNITEPDTSEKCFQLAETYFAAKSFNEDNMTACINMIARGESLGGNVRESFFWLNLILAADNNTPRAIAVKAHVACFIKKSFIEKLPEKIKDILMNEILYITYKYYNIIKNIPQKFLLDDAKQKILLSKIILTNQLGDLNNLKVSEYMSFVLSRREIVLEKHEVAAPPRIHYEAENKTPYTTNMLERKMVTAQSKDPIETPISDDEDLINNFIIGISDEIDLSPPETEELEHDDFMEIDINAPKCIQRFDNELNDEVKRGIEKNNEIENRNEKFKHAINTDFAESLHTRCLNMSITTNKELQELEHEIIRLANSKLEEGGTIENHMKDAKVTESLTMQNILHIFALQDRNSIMIQTHLSAAEITKLNDRIISYIKLKTYFQFLTRAYNKAKEYISETDVLDKEELAIELGTIITSKREYKANNNLTHLLLEYQGNILLRTDQVRSLDLMLKKEDGKYVNQLRQIIMGAGKTSAFLPLLAMLQADGFDASMVMVPRELLQIAQLNLSRIGMNVNGQKYFVFLFDRGTNTQGQYFKELYKFLCGARSERNCIITTPQSIMSLYLHYIEKTLESKNINSTEMHKEYEYLVEILKDFKGRTNLIVDEADTNLNIRLELNYSFGEDKSLGVLYPSLSEDAVKIIDECILVKPELLEYISGKKTLCDQAEISFFIKELTRMLVNNNGGIISSLIKKNDLNKENVERYLLDRNSYYDFGLSESDLGRLVAFRAIFSRFLELALRKTHNVQYGLRENPNDIFNQSIAVPYICAKRPHPRSTFENEFESILYTIFTHFSESINKKLFMATLNDILKERNDLVESKLHVNGEDIEHTKIYDRICAILKSLSLNDDFESLSSDEKDKIYLTNKDNHEFKKYILVYHVLPKIMLPTHRISANMFDILSLFKSTRGMTGTDYNYATSTPFLESCKSDTRGVDGQTINNIIKNTGTGNNDEIRYTETYLNIHDLFNKFDFMNTNIRAFIDQGAYCKEKDNKEVAIEICHYLQKKSSEIKFVLYFNKEDKLCAINTRNIGDPIVIGTDDESEIDKVTKSTKNERFTYYDQLHTTGVNVKQDKNAGAIFTVSKDLRLRDLLQAAMRMRGLCNKQKLHFLVAKELEYMIRSVKDIIIFAHRNQCNGLLEDYATATVKKMRKIVMEHIFSIFDALLPYQREKYIDDLASFVTTENNTNLFERYGQKFSTIGMEVYFNNNMTQLLSVLKTILKKVKGDKKSLDVDVTSIKQEMQDIISEALIICEDTITVSGTSLCEDMAQVEREAEQEKEEEQEQEEETQPQAVNDDVVRHVRIFYPNLNYEISSGGIVSFNKYLSLIDKNFEEFDASNIYLSPDSARVIRKRYYFDTAPEQSDIDYRKPMTSIMCLKKRETNEKTYIVLSGIGSDVSEAIDFFSNNSSEYIVDIFSLHGLLTYTTKSSGIDYDCNEHKELISTLSVFELQVDLLAKNRALLKKHSMSLVSFLSHNETKTEFIRHLFEQQTKRAALEEEQQSAISTKRFVQ